MWSEDNTQGQALTYKVQARIRPRAVALSTTSREFYTIGVESAVAVVGFASRNIGVTIRMKNHRKGNPLHDQSSTYSSCP
jgi:hypothetical protein